MKKEFAQSFWIVAPLSTELMFLPLGGTRITSRSSRRQHQSLGGRTIHTHYFLGKKTPK